MSQKTNAVRVLDQLGVNYELREYEVDENDLTAESVAAKVGLPPEQIFKTLVARGDRNGVCMAVVPGDAELGGSGIDLKSVALGRRNSGRFPRSAARDEHASGRARPR